jgi:hypothetical protein
LIEAFEAGKTVDYEKLRHLYITMVWERIEDSQALAYRICNRKVKHMLLLHENDLAALFIGELINHIRKQGWKTIPIEEAYQDPMATMSLTNAHSFMGQLGTIATEHGIDAGPMPPLQYIVKLVNEQHIFAAPADTK